MVSPEKDLNSVRLRLSFHFAVDLAFERIGEKLHKERLFFLLLAIPAVANTLLSFPIFLFSYYQARRGW